MKILAPETPPPSGRGPKNLDHLQTKFHRPRLEPQPHGGQAMPQYMIDPEVQKVYKEIIPESWFNLESEPPPPPPPPRYTYAHNRLP